MTNKTGPREVTIKIPRFSQLSKDKAPYIAGGIGFLIAFVFATSVLKQLNDLKKQQQTSEDRIKKEVLMPGGTNEYKAEFKPDATRDTAKDAVTEPATAPGVGPAPPAEPVPAPAPAPLSPAPIPAPPPTGPGNFSSNYDGPSYHSTPTGPGNM